MRNALVFVLLLSTGLTGCAGYHRMPLDRPAIEAGLRPPPMEEIRIAAGKIDHPLLAPIDLDLRDGLSPDEAAVIAVLVNPALAAERDRRGIAAAQILEAGILPDPQASTSLDVPTGGNRQGEIDAYGLGIDWDLTPLLARGQRLDAARASAASVDLDIAWEEWQVALAAKIHVYRIGFLRKERGVVRREEDGLAKNLEAIRQAADRGDMTSVDVSAATAARQEAHSSALALDQRLEEERLALNRTLGVPPRRVIPLQPGIHPPAAKALPSLEDVMDGIETRRLDLLALRMGYESQEARLRAAIRGRFPGIGLGFARLRDTGNVVTTGFSLLLDLPFFNRNRGQIAVERATRKQLFDEYIARLSEARAESARLLADIASTRERIEATLGSVGALEDLVQTVHSALLEGNADILSYYNARRDLQQKRVEAIDLKLDLADLTIALEIAAGGTAGPAREKETSP